MFVLHVLFLELQRMESYLHSTNVWTNDIFRYCKNVFIMLAIICNQYYDSYLKWNIIILYACNYFCTVFFSLRYRIPRERLMLLSIRLIRSPTDLGWPLKEYQEKSWTKRDLSIRKRWAATAWAVKWISVATLRRVIAIGIFI